MVNDRYKCTSMQNTGILEKKEDNIMLDDLLQSQRHILCCFSSSEYSKVTCFS